MQRCGAADTPLSQCRVRAVSVVQQKLDWREVEASEAWDVSWVDSSVSVARVMRLQPSQVWYRLHLLQPLRQGQRG